MMVANDASVVGNGCGKRVDEMWVTRRFPSLHRATALISTAGVGYRRQLTLNESASCAPISSEGRTAPTDTALVAHETPLRTNGADTSMPVSKRTRYEVLRRDNHTCRYCGGAAPDVVLTVDHVTPVALGGGDGPENLVAACKDCNAGKSSTTPGSHLVEDVKQDELKWSAALKQAATVLEAETDLIGDYVRRFQAAWPSYKYLPNSAEASVIALFRAGLPIEQTLDALDIALYSRGIDNRFAYFMGICWRRVNQMQETARQILAAEEAE